MGWGRKQKYLFNMRGWARPAPYPLPLLRWQSCGGRGGGLAGRVEPGDFERGRGDLWQASHELKWQIFLVSKFGGLFSRVNPAGCHGKIFWRVILAHLFGGSFWRIYFSGFSQSMKQANFKLQSKGKEKKRNVQSVNL